MNKSFRDLWRVLNKNTKLLRTIEWIRHQKSWNSTFYWIYLRESVCVSRVNIEFNENQNYIHMPACAHTHTNPFTPESILIWNIKKENIVIEKQELKNFEYVQYQNLVAAIYNSNVRRWQLQMVVPLFLFRCFWPALLYFILLLLLLSLSHSHHHLLFTLFSVCVHTFPLLCFHSSSCVVCAFWSLHKYWTNERMSKLTFTNVLYIYIK